MDNRGYFVVDGSRLFSSIFEIQRTNIQFKDKKLNLPLFNDALMRKWSVYVGMTVRIVYYFKKGDKRISGMLEIPKVVDPGKKDHWQIKECGESLHSIPEEELQKLSPQYRDHFMRAEKGLDIQLACDVLSLVSSGRASNIVFLVNDRDYVPLFQAIISLGGNVYLTALDSSQKIQEGLANLSDRYLTFDSELNNLFRSADQLSQPVQTISQQEVKSDTPTVDPITTLPTQEKS